MSKRKGWSRKLISALLSTVMIGTGAAVMPVSLTAGAQELTASSEEEPALSEETPASIPEETSVPTEQTAAAIPEETSGPPSEEEEEVEYSEPSGKTYRVYNFEQFGVIGGFNNWGANQSEIIMTDEDQDNMYEAIVEPEPGTYNFLVRAVDTRKDTWGKYDPVTDATKDTGSKLRATVGEGQKLLVCLDKTLVDPEAQINPKSFIYQQYAEMNEIGQLYWPVRYQLIEGETSGQLYNVSCVLQDTVTLGDEVKIYCRSAKGIGKKLYSVYYQEPGQTEWNTLSSLSVRRNITFTPTVTGAYQFLIKAKDENGQISGKTLTVNVTLPPLQNTSTVSKTSMTLGESISVECQAKGGCGQIRYLVTALAPGETTWKTLSSYTVHDSFTFCPDRSGTYSLKVRAKDEKGQISTVSFTIKVTSKIKETPASSFEYKIEYEGYDFEKDEYIYSVIIIEYIGSEKDVIIPKTIEGYPVKEVASFAFSNNETMESITIPESITNIGSVQFQEYQNLKMINVSPDNPSYCSEDGVLFNKEKTTLLRYPSAKYGSYSIPKTVKKILEYAFYKCKNLKSVTIPSSVKEIGESAFSVCSSLRSVTVPSGITTVASALFSYCNNLTSVSLPESVTAIGDDAFNYCDQLTDIRIPDKVTTIGARAFASCRHLKKISIPAKVKTIDYYAFLHCNRMERFHVSSENSYYLAEDGILYNKKKTELIAYPCARTGEYTLPETITDIPDNAFSECVGLTRLNLHHQVRSIGTDAFSDTKMNTLYIPGSVTTIGYQVIPYWTTIIVDSGSYAQKWAKENNYTMIEKKDVITDCGTYTLPYREGESRRIFCFEPQEDGIYAFRFRSKESFKMNYDNKHSVSQNNNDKQLLTFRKGIAHTFVFTENTKNITIEVLPSDQMSVTEPGTYDLEMTGTYPSLFFKAKEKGLYLFRFHGDGYYTVGGSQVSDQLFNGTQFYMNNDKTQQYLAAKLEKGECYRICTNYLYTPVSVTVCQAISGTMTLRDRTEATQPHFSFSNYFLKVDGTGSVTSTFMDEQSALYAVKYYIRTVTLSDGFTVIGRHAFLGCCNLRKITIPRSVTSIEDDAFTYFDLSNGLLGQEKTIQNITIVGFQGSYAEKYANENHLKFEPISVQNMSALSADHTTPGKSIVINAAADGGKAPYTYAIYYRKAGDASWTWIQNYRDNAKAVIKPKTLGDYEVRVAAKDATGDVSRKTLTFTVTEPLVNNSRMQSKYIAFGDKAKIYCKAQGGGGVYQYAVYFKKTSSSKWTKLRGYASANTLTLTPKAATSYDIRVYVKDQYGTVVRKDLSLIASDEQPA